MEDELEELIAELLSGPKPSVVRRQLAQKLALQGSMSDYVLADRLLGRVDLATLGLKPYRVYVLRSATLEQLAAPLRVKSLLAGLHVEVEFGPYGQYQQEILQPASRLYEFAPDVVVLAIELLDMLPELGDRWSSLGNEDVEASHQMAVETVSSLVRRFREQSAATLLVHNFVTPVAPSLGILDHQSLAGQAEAIRRLNRELVRICQEMPGAYVVDYDAVAARCGKAQWTDDRLQHLTRTPVDPRVMPQVADEHVRYLVATAGLTKKCLVLDLDNTLWGGVVGEEGPAGIHLGPNYPGSAYVAFQEALLALYHRGVVLAICSKNNPEDVDEVIGSHPHMVLRPEHFASTRVNWSDKASNIRAIAEELNLGTDSLVFIDDNPAEVLWITEALPEVTSLALPERPEHYAAFLQSLPYFEALSLTEEDRTRGEKYRGQVMREQMRASTSSLEEYYSGLEMRATIFACSPETLPRLAQLTQKTNQFNLTTRRYSEADIQKRLDSGQWLVYGVELDDRFGKNGIVGAAILEPRGEDAYIETLLLSCRVMGRTLEHTFVSVLAREARGLGLRRLIGEYRPTNKNRVVADLYETLSFSDMTGEGQPGFWCANLHTVALPPSPYIVIAGLAEGSEEARAVRSAGAHGE